MIIGHVSKTNHDSATLSQIMRELDVMGQAWWLTL
jgi:hypothetical protein